MPGKHDLQLVLAHVLSLKWYSSLGPSSNDVYDKIGTTGTLDKNNIYGWSYMVCIYQNSYYRVVYVHLSIKRN
jgi:hypothetical protein